MKASILFISLFLFSLSSVNSQIMSSKYNRECVALGFTTNSINRINPDVDNPNIVPSYLEIVQPTIFKISESQDLLSEIKKDNIAGKIFSNLLIKSNGEINVEYFFNRGEYNATDAEVITSRFAKEGKSLIQNLGFDVLNKVTILIINDNPSIKGNLDNKDLHADLFKVEINQDEFWNEVIDSRSNKLNVQKILNYNYNIIHVASVKANASYDRIFVKLARRYKPFRVTSNVFSKGPISSKIGTKEGVRINDLYQVLENKQYSDSSISQVSRGFVRVKSVLENNGNSNGNSLLSTFYRTFSGPVDRGMILRNVPDRGVFLGYSMYQPSDQSSLLSGGMYQVDFIDHLFAKGLFYTFGIGWSDNIQSKNLVYHSDVLRTDSVANSTGWNMQLSFGKAIQLNFIEISPQLGFLFGGYSVNSFLYKNKLIQNEDQSKMGAKPPVTFTAINFLASLKVGINLGKHLQVFSSIDKLYGGNSYETSVKGTSEILGKGLTKITLNNGPSLKFGIRLIGL
jgi:hypothetical protein